MHTRIAFLAKRGDNELLSTIDVAGCARQGCVGDKVNGERGDICWLNNPPDGKCGSKLVAALFGSSEPDRRRIR
ncbi:MAG: hypothetical protein ABSG02_15790 [Terriglobales bacterium]|jgi:hypothetical protein